MLLSCLSQFTIGVTALFISIIASLFEPLFCNTQVLRASLAFLVQRTEVVLRYGIALQSGLLIPFSSLCIILGHSLSL